MAILCVFINYKSNRFLSILPFEIPDGSSFTLSDASSLLFRLQLEGVNTGTRVEELAKKWTDHSDDFVSLFYDGHHCFTSLLAGDKAASNKLMDNMREYIAGDRKVRGF